MSCAEGRSEGLTLQQAVSKAAKGAGVSGFVKGSSPSVAMAAASSCLQKGWSNCQQLMVQHSLRLQDCMLAAYDLLPAWSASPRRYSDLAGLAQLLMQDKAVQSTGCKSGKAAQTFKKRTT